MEKKPDNMSIIRGEDDEFLIQPTEVGRPEVKGNELEATTFRKTIPRVDEAVFVLGHPRSGTSAMCQMLETDSLVTWLADLGQNQHNVYGYYEYRPALQLSTSWINSPPAEMKPDQASTVLTTMKQLKGVVGLKLIHMLSWWYWRWVVKSPRLVCIFRDPSDCQRSQMRQRLHSFGPSWMDQNNQLITIFEHERDRSVLVKHERLMNHPEQVSEKVEDELGFKTDPSIIDSDQHTIEDSKMVMDHRETEIFGVLSQYEEEQYDA